jgi:mannitol/fructose-specific phosphotransferase system IIA component
VTGARSVTDDTSAVLRAEGVQLGLEAADKWDAVRQSGALLVALDACEPGYADAMLERERSVSTFIGEGVAIPHGTDGSRSLVKRTALGVLQFPKGVDWDGNDVKVCVAIASSGNEHVAVLSALAQILMEPDDAERLRSARSSDDVLALLAGIGDEIHEESST